MNFKLTFFQLRANLPKVPTYLRNRFIKKIKIDAPPIFIVCAAHSGSTLMINILQNHSRIYGIPGESKFGETFFTPILPSIFNFLAIAHGKPRWVEKTAKSVHHIDRLLKIRDSKIILMIRDGRDVAVSIKNRTGSLERGIRRWVNNNKEAEPYWHNPRLKIVRYEELVKDAPGVVRDVLTFLDESYEEKIMDYHKNPFYFFDDKIEQPEDSTAKNLYQYRNWQVNQPIFDGSKKWKTLSEEEKDFIKDYAGDMLIKYGYVKDQSW